MSFLPNGHSHVLALANPSVRAYDPAYAYEIAVIVREGLQCMLAENGEVVYYLTVMNEFYPMPAMHEGVKEGILYWEALATEPSYHQPKKKSK